MSKVEQILANNTRVSAKSKPGIRGGRARIVLLSLVLLLAVFILMTDPHMRSLAEPVLGQIPGL
ncbi:MULTISPECIES: hypothetical protein [unclassified Ruegeria]|uniref:hypothetical protein n=1 Tax=unclassified Ruegeria TaxID=2625375 RepID=UPI0014879FD4|nr:MULTISPECIES: hypothetical protein [unclassified Ruegeria]